MPGAVQLSCAAGEEFLLPGGSDTFAQPAPAHCWKDRRESLQGEELILLLNC